ncbi:MAG: hypothetical protein JRH06_11385 [Deltaproteobacteria bacterium]|nr:hypothetical protein [Deltaproteobacteria bacterium]MBW2138144.1 hypothetical protein [Deltaproteobacteria bacterium]
MVDTSTVVFGIVIVLVFIWRFARTRQLYLTSLHVQASGSEPIPFSPRGLRSFVHQALLGRRSMKPMSFLVRAFVFVVVAACLLPFKDYEPLLYWLVVILIALYVPWCIAHGVMLKKRSPDDGAN